MYDVLSVGIMVADVIVKPVDAFPKRGALEVVDSVEVFSGGNAMTAAINITKLGLKSALISKVGNDAFGDFLVNHLEKCGVTSKGIKRTDEVNTSASVVISNSDGERSILHYKGSNNSFCLNDIDFDIVKDSNVVFVTGSFLMGTFDGNDTVEFLKECKRLGKTTALDVCWDANTDSNWLLYDAMPYIDLFMPSIDEAKMIAGRETPDEIADVCFENGATSVIIKCGGEGCYIRKDKDSEGVMVPPFYVKEVVDTTGAGDSFCSGFLSAFAKGMDILDCTKFGNAVGACCVMKKGATNGTLTFDETVKFMENFSK